MKIQRNQFQLKPYHFLITPAIIYVLAFTLYPTIYCFYISLTDFKLGLKSVNFIGFSNYVRLFTWEFFPEVLGNTAIYVVGTVLLQIILGLSIALMLNRRLHGRTIIRAIAVLPWVIPGIATALTFQLLFNSSRLGSINIILTLVGSPPVDWLVNSDLAKAVLVFANTWRSVPFVTVLYLAALQTVPEELMEAARLDGAGSVKTFFAVKLPLMKHTILITLIMSSAAAVNMLAIVKGLTEGGPGRSTEVLALTLYNQSFEFISPGFGASIAMFLLFVNICLTIGYIFILRIRGELIQ